MFSREYHKAYRLIHRAKKQAYDAEWAKKNPEKIAMRGARYRAKNKERDAARKRAYRLANKEKVNALSAYHRALRLQATPKWANKFFISEAYHLATLRTKMFGFPWHVDHVIPLKSYVVCGLHVESNLQVIPGRQNQSKGNSVMGADHPVALGG